MKNASKKAYGRISLLGNPSDIYGGKCISFTFDKYAIVNVRENSNFKITGEGIEERNLIYNGRHNLLKATIKRFNLQNKRLAIEYESSIPYGSGLGGSSAIIIAGIRALNDYYNLSLSNYTIAELALVIETEELGISAGFQDRYAIAFEGVNYMDFKGKEFMKPDDEYGYVERLNVSNIPFFLALGEKPKSSASVHNPLRNRFLRRGKESKRIKEEMDRIAELAYKGREYMLKGKWDRVGQLMNQNTILRENLCPHLSIDKKMINDAHSYGVLGAKVAGSGGAVVILSEKKEIFDLMSSKYPCYRPGIIE